MMHQLQTAKTEEYIIYSDVRVLMSYTKLVNGDGCVDCNGVDNLGFFIFLDVGENCLQIFPLNCLIPNNINLMTDTKADADQWPFPLDILQLCAIPL